MGKSGCAILVLLPFLFIAPLQARALSADDLRAILPTITAAEQSELASTNTLTRLIEPNETPDLIPSTSLDRSVREALTSVKYSVGVESVFIAPYSHTGDGSHLLAWYNTLRSVSKLRGVEYYSTLFRKTRVLFRDSYAVDGESTQRPVPDPLVRELPSDDSILIKQDDSTFGVNLFKLRYRAADDSISMSMSNLNSLNLFLVPVVGPGNMVMEIVVLPYKGYRVFYGCVVVRVATFLGFESFIRDSFYYRVKALYSWFDANTER